MKMKHHDFSRRTLRTLGIAVAVACLSPATRAQELYFWSSSLYATNYWSIAVTAAPMVSNDIAHLSGIIPVNGIVTNDTSISLGGLWIGNRNNNVRYVRLYSSNDSKITFTNLVGGMAFLSKTNNWTDTPLATGTDIVGTPIILGANLGVSNLSQVGQLRIEGDISESVAGRAMVVVAGTGVTLAGNNSFSGGLTLSSGTLTAIGATALGAGVGPVTLGDTSGALNAALITGGHTFNHALTVAAGSAGTAALTVNDGGAAVWTGAVALNKSLTLDSGTGSLDFSGDITGAGGLVKNGSGSTILSGENSYTGGTQVNTGSLSFADLAAQPDFGTTTVAAGAALGLGVGGAGYFSSDDVDDLWDNVMANVTLHANSRVGIDTSAGDFEYATGQSTRGLVKMGDNTLTLSGDNSFGGVVTIIRGALRATHANALGSTVGGTVVATGAALEFAGGVAIGAEALSVSGAGVGGAGALRNISGDNSYAGAIETTGATAIASDSGRLTLTGGIGTSAGTAVGRDLTFGGAGAVAVTGVIGTGGSQTIRNLIKDGAGALTLSAANDYTGSMTLNEGTLNLGHPSALSGGTLVLAGGTIDNTSGGAMTLGAAHPVTISADFAFGGTHDLNLGGGAVGFGNTITRLMTLNGGSVLTFGDAAFSRNGSATITVSQGTGSGAKLILGAVDLHAHATQTATGHRIFDISADVDILGAITSLNNYAVSLTKSGTGTMTIYSANNAYNGPTTVNGGTLRLGADNGVGTVGQVFIQDGLFDLNGFDQSIAVDVNLTLGGVAGGTPVIQTGAGTLTLMTTINQCAIQYNATGNPNGAVIDGKLHLNPENNNLLVQLQDSAATDKELTINAVISDTNAGGIFYSTGAGTMVLNGANIFNMIPQIRQGTVILGVNDYGDGSTAGALGVRNANASVGYNYAGPLDAALLLKEGVTTHRTVNLVDDPDLDAVATARTLGGVNSAGTATFAGDVNLDITNVSGGIARLTAATGGTVVFSGTMAGDGGVTKIGNGTVHLTGNNTYTGTTTVEAGTLVIDGIYASPGLITTKGGATLGGVGVVGNITVESTGNLAPGNSIGEMEGTSLTLDGGSVLKWELDDNGIDADLLTLSGAIRKGSGTGWTFDFLGTGAVGTYTLIKFGSSEFSTGEFSYTGLKGGLSAPAGVVVNDSINEIQLTVIPEPASLGTLGILAIATLLRRRLRS